MQNSTESASAYRRRGTVDYAALNLRLEEENRRSKQEIKGPLSESAPPAEPLIPTAAPVQPQSTNADVQASRDASEAVKPQP